MKFIFVGGGSGGPVAPLLAIADTIKSENPKVSISFVGTKEGPEKNMVEQTGFKFHTIYSGKLKRYFSVSNFIAPFYICVGFLQSFFILRKLKPDCVFGAGSFVQVPFMWAAFFLRIPVVIHQQDVFPSLSNQLCALIASTITVTFEDSLRDFPSGLGLLYKKDAHKAVWTGNPFRNSLKDIEKSAALKKFELHSELPVVLVLGGGTGADAINKLVVASLPVLTKNVQIIHATGKGKLLIEAQHNYHPYEFISDMAAAYKAADIVVCRAGLSTITELSNLKKVSIMIPMPKSHQEYNAWTLSQREASVVISQKLLDAEKFSGIIRKVLIDGVLQKKIQNNIGKVMPHGANEKISHILIEKATRNARN